MARVLVADDDPAILDICTEVLALDGLDVDVACYGLQARDRSLSERYDALLLDVQMPGMSGTDVCLEVKGRPDTCDTPVIVMSAAGSYISAQVKQCGADAYLPKPFDIDVLLSVVGDLTGGYSQA